MITRRGLRFYVAEALIASKRRGAGGENEREVSGGPWFCYYYGEERGPDAGRWRRPEERDEELVERG